MQKRTENNNLAPQSHATRYAERETKAQQPGVENIASIDLGVQNLISQFISSVEQIEILCILMQDAGKRWSTDEILRIVQSSEPSVIGCLTRLKQAGFLASEGSTYFYSPNTPELAQAALAMCSTYRERRVTVTEMIYRGMDQP